MKKEVYVYRYDGDTEYVTSDKKALLYYLRDNYHYYGSISEKIEDIEKELKDEWSGIHEIEIIHL